MWTTLYVCHSCGKGVVVRLKSPGRTKPSSCPGDPRRSNFKIQDTYPEPQKITAPEHAPDEIEQDYKEAMDSLRHENWTSAGMMFRKVLQRSTSTIGPDSGNLKSKRLKKRIIALAEQHKLTPAMAELAHVIRLGGDDATHEEEEEFTKEEATEIQNFTELFLLYSFTLPTRVKKARAKYESRDTSASS